MEEIIRKVIDIDNQAIELEDKALEKIEEQQKSLIDWLKDIEVEEEKKAEEKINEYQKKIRKETEAKIKKLDEKEQNQLKVIENNYNENKDMIIKKAIKKVLEIEA